MLSSTEHFLGGGGINGGLENSQKFNKWGGGWNKNRRLEKILNINNRGRTIIRYSRIQLN